MKCPGKMTVPRREGTAVLVVIVALVVATSIAALALRAFVVRDQQARIQLEVIQADQWVAAGRSLVRARLAADSAYEGETWELPPENLPRGGTAQVEIAMAETNPDQPALEIMVTYQTHTGQRITRRQVVPSLLSTENSE
ncbi:MAG: hypothetical protein WDZ51_02025 [Pirellulaceae bacterium]